MSKKVLTDPDHPIEGLKAATIVSNPPPPPPSPSKSPPVSSSLEMKKLRPSPPPASPSKNPLVSSSLSPKTPRPKTKKTTKPLGPRRAQSPAITARWLKSLLDAASISRPEDEIALWVRIMLAAGAQRVHELGGLSERAWSRVDLPVIVEDAVRNWLEEEYGGDVENGKVVEGKVVVGDAGRAAAADRVFGGDEPMEEDEMKEGNEDEEEEIDPYTDVELAKLVALDDIEDGRWRAAGGDPELGPNSTFFKRLKRNPTARQAFASVVFILTCVGMTFLYRFIDMLGHGDNAAVLYADHGMPNGDIASEGQQGNCC
ncbi:hypothetical protein TrST_g2089 [Triparma strigata]|uniref:Uncharacterized protein n=1 Tax=Triparma strigata TaxID=1606541 RepID=A0A9W7BHT8_9STRA|nr:hypothetical protein TrST_g2089 [Triparma strigata]